MRTGEGVLDVGGPHRSAALDAPAAPTAGIDSVQEHEMLREFAGAEGFEAGILRNI